MRWIYWKTATIVLAFTFLLSGLASAQPIKIVSFNIQFLGHFKDKQNEALADVLSPYDIVFVQELVAPPYPGIFPDGTPFRPDKEANAFFEAMAAKGFDYILSEEDTGTRDNIHKNDSGTEWFVVFYKPDRAIVASDLPNGFLAMDRSNHPDFERVPYAFPFKIGEFDLVFISVHLQPGTGTRDHDRRAHELEAIFAWIEQQPGPERDYVILGDMNIEDCDELTTVTAPSFVSLNDTCVFTNTINSKPYDHVLYRKAETSNEINVESFHVVNLIETMRPYWPISSGPYPGDPYDYNEFRVLYSDHHPIVFEINELGMDDD